MAATPSPFLIMESQGTKQPWHSRTLWGAVAMLVAMVLRWFSVEADPDALTDDLLKIAEAINVIVGVVLIVVGRIKATKQIKLPAWLLAIGKTRR